MKKPIRRHQVALVLFALLALAAASWLLALAPLGPALGIAIALAIAATKAALVGLFFMELADARATVRLVALAGPVFVALLLAFAVADVVTR